MLAEPAPGCADSLHEPGSPAHRMRTSVLSSLLASDRALVIVGPTVSDADVRVVDGGAAGRADLTFGQTWDRTEVRATSTAGCSRSTTGRPCP